MFARNVSIHLKSNMLSDYTRTFEKDVLPLLRKQNGFKDEITFSGPGGVDVTAISLWENKTDAETYNTNTYPEVLKTIGRFIEGTPKVQTADVVTSTFHKFSVAVGTEVRQLMVLPVRPQVLDRVQFRSVGRQKLQPQAPALLAHEVPHHSAAVTPQAIPDDQQLAGQMA